MIGVAIDVPAISVRPHSAGSFEFADVIGKPGATTSGLIDPLARGLRRKDRDPVLAAAPELEFSEAPTVTQFLHVAGAPTEPGRRSRSCPPRRG